MKRIKKFTQSLITSFFLVGGLIFFRNTTYAGPGCDAYFEVDEEDWWCYNLGGNCIVCEIIIPSIR